MSKFSELRAWSKKHPIIAILGASFIISLFMGGGENDKNETQLITNEIVNSVDNEKTEPSEVVNSADNKKAKAETPEVVIPPDNEKDKIIDEEKENEDKSEFQSQENVIINPSELEIGKSYIIDRMTPLMPENNPENVMEALSKMIKIPVGGYFKISGKEEVELNTWFSATAYDDQANNIGTGWIMDTALLGQGLVEK